MKENHSYSVFYSYYGKPAILKATATEIRICDQYNKLICKHRRAYAPFPKYITDNEHMKPEHLYYKEVNAKDGNTYADAVLSRMTKQAYRLECNGRDMRQSN